jgi:hypothetical protein
MQSKKFYYHFDWLNAWFILNAVLLIMLIYIAVCCPRLYYWPQTQVLLGTFIFSCLMWYFKCIYKHQMAEITDEYIKIDHTEPLYWRDVAGAEIREVWCCLKKRKILVLLPKTGIDYQYNFLQRHNGAFTPFSVPLYGILTPQDEQEIIKQIEAHVAIKDTLTK